MSIVDELAGKLSASEIAGRSFAAPRLQARQHYEALLAAATAARDELSGALIGRAHHRVTKPLVNALVWANRHLWLAARQVCQVEQLAHDGARDGIQWEVSL